MKIAFISSSAVFRILILLASGFLRPQRLPFSEFWRFWNPKRIRPKTLLLVNWTTFNFNRRQLRMVHDRFHWQSNQTRPRTGGLGSCLLWHSGANFLKVSPYVTCLLLTALLKRMIKWLYSVEINGSGPPIKILRASHCIFNLFSENPDFVNKLPVGLLWFEYQTTKMSSSPVFSQWK